MSLRNMGRDHRGQSVMVCSPDARLVLFYAGPPGWPIILPAGAPVGPCREA